MSSLRPSVLLTMLIVLALSPGCAPGRKPSSGPERPVTLAMPEVQELYFAYQKAEGKPPAKLADFDKLKQAYPRGFRAIQSGEIVVLWNTDLAADEPIAYEKTTPETGGLVLFGGGAMKEMAAAEFKALKK